ncbi:putative chromatin remodeling SWIB-Plus-3 family [Rosa chinensis]|uniref:Putative chromatin remodeling SWIB-Plus-3 family n=1 Tax=Rosa chinensis TaxID=74649 RepID=A0A2P6REV0_ROSCH|nr:putative chromatin remodeling SWIB-Plus-3 family [Rosa chinensis]
MGSFTWVGEYNAAVTATADVDAAAAAAAAPTRRSKRLHRPKKFEFLSWGSRPLIEFLESIGKDTTKQISQYDVATIITDYVNHRRLLHPTKRKRIVCDDGLHSLFGRKTIARIKIYDLLQPHFAENLEDDSDDSSDESDDDGLDEEDEDKQRRQQQQQRKKQQKRRAASALHAPPPVPKSCYAAVIPENLKLVYLRRSVVEALLKQGEAQVFEDKVVGSFVRTKSDPNDYLQKNSHQLMQVKAILKKPEPNSESSAGGGVLLQLHGAVRDFSVSMLSDDNFFPEECEDLRERVKGGLLKRPTVVELQQKVQILHLDVTKHWLVRELQYLQNSIDRANEKGLRREYPFKLFTAYMPYLNMLSNLICIEVLPSQLL